MSAIGKCLADLHNSIKLLLGLVKEENISTEQITIKDEQITSERLTSLSKGIADLTTKCSHRILIFSNLI